MKTKLINQNALGLFLLASIYLPGYFPVYITVLSIYNFDLHILATKSFHQPFTSNSHGGTEDGWSNLFRSGRKNLETSYNDNSNILFNG